MKIKRVSRKPEIQPQFLKLPDRPNVLGWFRVTVPGKKSTLIKRGFFNCLWKMGRFGTRQPFGDWKSCP